MHVHYKTFFSLVFTVLMGLSANGQQSFSQLFDEGNEFYKKDSIERAIKSYEQAAQDYESAALYYNLGNAHYKLGHLGKSILYYEKAKKHDPTDNSIQHNLALANLGVKDKVEEQVSPISELIGSTPTNLFSWLSILFFLVLFIGLYLLYIKENKNLGTLISLISIALFIISIVLATTKRNLTNQNNHAIILSQEIDVLSAPSNQTGNSVFKLHEGTKVEITRAENNWLEVSINGNIGWIKLDDCRII